MAIVDVLRLISINSKFAIIIAISKLYFRSCLHILYQMQLESHA